MSEDFSNNHSAKYSDVVNTADFYQHINNISENSEELGHPYDHIYASNNDNSDIETHKQKPNCQTAESEVRFLKQWLLLHLDLIQQQNEEILSKEKTILILQQENEMLKERLNCMEETVSLVGSNQSINHTEEINIKVEKFAEDMTQGLGSCNDIKDTTQLEVNCNNVDSTSIDSEVQQDCNSSGESKIGICETILDSIDCISGSVDPCAELNFDSGIDANAKTESDTLENLSSCVVYNFSSELDSMRHLRMSIRRKRVCSHSSATSQNGYTIEEKKIIKRFKKRRKKSIKDNQIISTPDFYVNQIGDPIPGIPMSYETEPETEVTDNAVLEVPRWRVKLYASCYTMEGTENLDDEVFLKRHSRLEIDERRRKRWDVQRIREQRVIEKLKQRHEKSEFQVKVEISNELSTPFWQTVDDVKIIEVSEELPVASFGTPLPRFGQSDFNMSWLDVLDTSSIRDKILVKKGLRRRKLKR